MLEPKDVIGAVNMMALNTHNQSFGKFTLQCTNAYFQVDGRLALEFNVDEDLQLFGYTGRTTKELLYEIECPKHSFPFSIVVDPFRRYDYQTECHMVGTRVVWFKLIVPRAAWDYVASGCTITPNGGIKKSRIPYDPVAK